MRIGLKTVLAAGLGVALVQWPSRAQDKTALKDDREKASYGVGMYFGNQIKRSNMDLDLDTVMSAVKDVIAGHETKLTDAEQQKAIRTYEVASQKKIAEKNKKEGEEFLAENKTKAGVKTAEVKLRNGSTAEMQYKVITEGTGSTPQSNDVVEVNYRGTLINGKEFDNSAKRGGQPATFPVTRVIPGWTAALEMMKVGSKWDLYLPSDLAYGDSGNPRSNPPIEPGSTLIFEMELVGIQAPPAHPAPQQPLTSDIIKVPSAEELKKGAKIEVIKPEEAAKLAQQGQTNNATKK